MIIKRGRGRPPGEGIKDGPILMELAAAVLADSRTKVAPVVRRIIRAAGSQVRGASELAIIRRVQDKWKAGKEQYLDQVRAQRALVDLAMRPSRGRAQPRSLRPVSAIDRALDDLGVFGSGLHRRTETTVGRAVREAHEKAHALVMGHETHTQRSMREYFDSPTQRAMRELLDSPTQRAIREFQNSPTMRALYGKS